MKLVTTHLSKMSTSLEEEVQYYMPYDGGMLHLNPLIGQEIAFSFDGVINCMICGKKTKKSFGNGACYSCFMNAPQAAPCIVNPELCEAHLGKGRDPDWEDKHHNQDHIVYLAKSSAIKIGVTRSTQVPTRWIDQGASEAIILAEVPYRQLAGAIEVQMKEFFTDKTNWQRMLKNEVSELDLIEAKEEAIQHFLDEEFYEYIADDDEIIRINYPVSEYPSKVKSVKLDKEPIIESVLEGIKGQYMYLEDGRVINIRNHSGYLVEFNY